MSATKLNHTENKSPVIRVTLAFDALNLVRPPLAMLVFAVLSTWFVLATYGLTGYPIGGDSQSFWTEIHEKFSRYSGVYLPSPGLGVNGSDYLPLLFPLLSFALALAGAGMPGEAIPRVAYIAMLFAGFSGAYVCIRYMLTDYVSAGLRDAASFAGALLYGFNPWILVSYAMPPVDLTLTTSVLPWAACAAAYAVRRGFLRGASAIALVFVFGGNGNPARFSVIPLTILAMAVGTAWDANRGWRAAAVIGAGLCLGFFCSLWWLLPLTTIAGAGLHAVAIQNTTQWLAWMSERSTLLHLFELRGNLGEQDLPNLSWYSSPLGNVLGYIPTAIAVLGIGQIRRRLSVVLLFTFLATIMLAKGTQPPLGAVYEFLVRHVDGFSAFRSPYDKWIPIATLTLSMLFSFGIAAIAQTLRARLPGHFSFRRRAVLIAAFAVVILVRAWPALAGHDLKSLGPGHSPVGFVPTAYRETARYIQRLDPFARVVIFDEGAPPFARFAWGYIGDDPLLTLSANPISAFSDLLDGFDGIEPRALAATLSRLNVRFVIVHRDVENPEYSPNVALLERAGLLHLRLVLPYLELYELTRPPEPFVRVPAPTFRIGPGPFGTSVLGTDSSVGRPPFSPDWSTVVTFEGRPANLVYAKYPESVLGMAREILPRPRGSMFVIGTRPGESLFYAPAVTFRRSPVTVQCATLAPKLQRDLPAWWTVNGKRLPVLRSTDCPRTRQPETIPETRTGIISFGNSRSARRLILRRGYGATQRTDIFSVDHPTNLKWLGGTERFGSRSRPWFHLQGAEWPSLHAEGPLNAETAYTLHITYDAVGSAVLRYQDAVDMHDVQLTADGGRHSVSVRIYPSPGGGTKYGLSILVYHGSVNVLESMMVQSGPNGTFYALKPPAVRSVGRVTDVRSHFPIGADFQLHNCHACLVEAGISGDGWWTLSGSSTLIEPVLGMGHAQNGFQALSPGLAGWLLKSSAGRQNMSLSYEPMKTFKIGLLLSTIGLFMTFAFAGAGFARRSLSAANRPQERPQISRLQFAFALSFLVVSPFVDIFPPSLHTAFGELLLSGLIAFGVASIFIEAKQWQSRVLAQSPRINVLDILPRLGRGR